MRHWKLLGGTAALAIAAGGAAQADVTSAQVWDAWKSVVSETGQTITVGSESQDGGTLTLSDVTFAMQTTDVSATANVAEMVLTEQGDGTVAITLSPSYEVKVSVDPEDDDESVDMTLTLTSENLGMIASGDPDAVKYDYTADSLTASVTELVVEGETLELDADIVMRAVTGDYTTGADDSMSSRFDSDSMTITVHMDEPDGGDGTLDATMEYADVAITSDGSMALMAGGVKELSGALAEGGTAEGSISHGDASYQVAFVDGSDTFSLDGTAQGGLLEYALSAEAMSYNAGNTGLDMVITGSEIPLPEVAVQLGEFGLGLTTPVSKSEEPQDFSFALRLVDLAVSDMIWSMIDQGGQLPHDPATVIFDVSGKANFLFDLFDPDSMEMADSEMPAEIHALDLNELKLAIAGAVLTGEGGFTFDMDNLAAFDGLPAPTGKVNLMLVGANTLLDKLVAMGLIPEDQAMGARMMMGLFARPGDGEDTLVSEIEVDGATGAISANGQRLQ